MTHALRALLWWRLPADSMLDDFNISLQLLTPEGANVRQVDHYLDTQLVPWGVRELSTADLPPATMR